MPTDALPRAVANATLHDGTAPVPRPALVALAPGGIEIAALDGSFAARWALGEITLVDRRRDSLTLARRGGEARVKLADAALAASVLRALGPGLRRDAWIATAKWSAAGIALIAGAALFLVLAWPTLADRVADALPDEWLDGLGESTVRVIAGGKPACSDAKALALLHQMAEQLSDAADRDPPDIMVLRSPTANAFALPGNRIIVLSGLIAEAKDPNEIAGVLAHEIGHLEKRHPARQLVRQGGLFLLVELFTGGSSFGAFGATAVATGYSRDFEREADDFARQTLAAAGIDARPVAGFFRRMADKEKQTSLPFGLALDYLSTHPASADRAEAFARETGGSPAIDDAQFAALKQICGK